jgi:hypothetical protein
VITASALRENYGRDLLTQKVWAATEAYMEDFHAKSRKYQFPDRDVRLDVVFQPESQQPGWYLIILFSLHESAIPDPAGFAPEVSEWSLAIFGPRAMQSQYQIVGPMAAVYLRVDRETLEPEYVRSNGWMSWKEMTCR